MAFRAAGEIAKGLSSSGSRIGAFNAGALSAWAAPGTTVINLDGVVNHSAIAALRSRSLADYIDTNGIVFIVDLETSLAFYDAIGGGSLEGRLERIETIPSGFGPDLGIWRVKSR